MLAADEVRAALREAGFREAGADSAWGYRADDGQSGIVRLCYVPNPQDRSLRLGNTKVSAYVRALQSKGFRVLRMKGVSKADTLLVMEPKSNLPVE